LPFLFFKFYFALWNHSIAHCNNFMWAGRQCAFTFTYLHLVVFNNWFSCYSFVPLINTINSVMLLTNVREHKHNSILNVRSIKYMGLMQNSVPMVWPVDCYVSLLHIILKWFCFLTDFISHNCSFLMILLVMGILLIIHCRLTGRRECWHRVKVSSTRTLGCQLHIGGDI
jgi:hypothetical protein